MSRLPGWSDVVGWAQKVLTERHNYLPKYEMVLRKTNLEPYISCGMFTDLEEFLRLGPSGRRSCITRFSLMKFSKFFCGESYVKIFREIIC